MIEFALILPAFVVLTYGSISGATVYSHKRDVINAVRDGSRYGATVPQAQCTPTSNCNSQTWAQMVQALVVAHSSGSLIASQVCVALVSGSTGTVVGGSGNQASWTTQSDGSSSCFNDGNADTGTRVQVSAVRTGDSIDAALWKIPVTESSKTTEHFEQ